MFAHTRCKRNVDYPTNQGFSKPAESDGNQLLAQSVIGHTRYTFPLTIATLWYNGSWLEKFVGVFGIREDGTMPPAPGVSSYR